MNDLNHRLFRIHKTFEHEVVKTTAKLLYLLQGIGTIRDPNPSPASTTAFPGAASLRTSPLVTVGNLGEFLRQDGEVEQLVFKGWVQEVYRIWEDHRGKVKGVFKDTFDDEGMIRPETPCMGDFRHIRNDFIHSGVATNDHSGKCEILKWFEPPEPIVFKMEHVLDFLNQMALLGRPQHFTDDDHTVQLHGWVLLPDRSPNRFDNGPKPRLISVRKSIDEDGEGGGTRLMISCVFEDGVFGVGPIESSISKEMFLEGTIGADGDFHFPDGRCLRAEALYPVCVGFLEGHGSREEGKGMFGPPLRINKKAGS